MDARFLAKLGVRLLALFMIGIGLMILPSLVDTALDYAREGLTRSLNALFVSEGLAPFVFGIILWIVAPYLAKSLVGKVEVASTTVAADAMALQTAAFVVLGVYFVVENLPVFVGLLIEAIGYGPNGNVPLANGQSIWLSDRTYATLLRTLLGVALVLGAGFFTRLFRRFGEFGLVRSE